MMPLMMHNHKITDQLTTVAGKKFLTFMLGDDVYAIDILNIQQIKSLKNLKISSVCDAPSHIQGIISLYDVIIPVIDLGKLYHLNPPENNEYNVIIILNVSNKYFGIAVDTVLDVVELIPDHIKVAPDIFTAINREYIDGIGTLNENLIMILNIEKLIHCKEIKLDKEFSVK